MVTLSPVSHTLSLSLRGLASMLPSVSPALSEWLPLHNLGGDHFWSPPYLVCNVLLMQLNPRLGIPQMSSVEGPHSYGRSSVGQSRPTPCDPMDCSTPGFPIHHQLPEFAQTHVHWVDDAVQPSHPLSPPSAPSFNLSQHQGLFQWVSSAHQVAKVLEFQLQHQSLQWILRTAFL